MTASKGRAGFTLIELLVVIALMGILAAMAAMFLPALGHQTRAAEGGTQLQQWVSTAKNRALRDKVPNGLRLILSSDNRKTNLVTELQFVVQPDDFAVAPTAPAGNLTGTKDNHYALISGMVLTDEIAVGDFLEIFGGGLLYKIVGVWTQANPAPPIRALPNPGPNNTQLEFEKTSTNTSKLPYDISATKIYRIIRAPRVTGDEPLQMPSDVYIDLTTNNSSSLHASSATWSPLPTFNTEGSLDLMFSPSGALITPGVTTDSVNLWVRWIPVEKFKDPPTTPTFPVADPKDGNQSIIGIYVRTGATAAHPPSSGIDPYAFLRDGRTSGK